MRFLFPLLLLCCSHRPYISEGVRPTVDACLRDLYSEGICPKWQGHIDSIIIVPRDTTLLHDPDTEAYSVWDIGQDNLIKIYLKAYTSDCGVPAATYYRYIVYHELGHALFRLPHRERGLDVMNAYSDDNHYGRNCWERLRAAYIKRVKKSVLFLEN